jgi:hypothetical protein
MKNLRKYLRKSCSENTFFATQTMVFEGLIKNISAQGVFIESLLSLPVGQIITVAIPSNHHHRSKELKIEGMVVWTDEDGFGVEFNEIIKL